MGTKKPNQSKRRRMMSVDAIRERQEKKAIKLSLKRLREQAESLGLLDPLDVEPAPIYSPSGASND